MPDAMTEITGRTPFPDAARATVERLSGQMMENLPGTKSGQDIEALHDMRVASRRLRSALRVFRRCFTPETFEPVESEAKSVTQALGQVRDQDVFIDFLRGWADAHADTDIEWLIDREEKIRDGARLRLLDEMDRVEEIDLPGTIGKIEVINPDGRKNTFASHAAPLVEKRMDELVDLSKVLKAPENITGHHLMRIGAKRLRYTMEIFIPAFGKPLEDEIANLKLLQDQLGLMHDCDVWVDKLRLYHEEPGLSSERLGALDQLIEERSSRRRESFNEAVEHWKTLEKTKFPRNVVKLLAAKPEKGVTAMEKAPEQAPAEQPAPKPRARKATAKPKKEPTLVDTVREAMAQANTRLSAANKLSPKLARQLGKVEAMLTKLPTEPTADQDKTNKRLEKIRETLLAVPEDGSLSSKKIERLRESVRADRRKLEPADGKAGS